MSLDDYFALYIEGLSAGFAIKLMVDMIILAINGIFSIFRKTINS